MISISRSLARQFRAVMRRAIRSKPGSIGNSCVRLIATKETLTLQATNGRAAIEHQSVGQFEVADVTVPLQLFADCEAKNDDRVTIHLAESGRILAIWNDRGVPQQRDYAVPAAVLEMPVMSQDLTTNSPGLLVALREARATVDPSPTRYALDCLQMRGATGTIAATDSRQLLVQSGFQFPWRDDVLMRASDVFACRDLPSDVPVEIGRTEDGVTVRIGEWTIHHEIDKESRFPNVDRIIPSPTSIKSRMQIDETDAKFLAATVTRLPADDLTERPLTIELNGAVAVRAQKDEQSPITELLLSRSRRVGDQLRIHTNREFLTRALELGFSEIGFVDNQSPCVCQDATRTYLWMVLEPKTAVEPSATAQTIDSMSFSAVPAGRLVSSSTAKTRHGDISPAARTSIAPMAVTPVNRVAGHLTPQVETRLVSSNEVTASSAPTQPTDVIEQALQLRSQLRGIVQGLTELVTQIRQQRKHTRLMKSTLQSLKQLQLLDA